jgi:hypothetical protein
VATAVGPGALKERNSWRRQESLIFAGRAVAMPAQLPTRRWPKHRRPGGNESTDLPDQPPVVSRPANQTCAGLQTWLPRPKLLAIGSGLFKHYDTSETPLVPASTKVVQTIWMLARWRDMFRRVLLADEDSADALSTASAAISSVRQKE